MSRAKDGSDTPLVIFVKNRTGLPVYTLECHNGEDLEWSPIVEQNRPQLRKFTLSVAVEPDKAARSATAEKGKAPRLPNSCN